MLLGYYGGVGGFVPGPLSPTNTAGNPQDHVFNYFAPYAMDHWRVTPKLTLDLGLRWDYRAAAYEASNHFFWLDTKNPQGGLCYADPQLIEERSGARRRSTTVVRSFATAVRCRTKVRKLHGHRDSDLHTASHQRQSSAAGMESSMTLQKGARSTTRPISTRTASATASIPQPIPERPS